MSTFLQPRYISKVLMQLIRCTGKLQKEAGLKKSDLSMSDEQDGLLGQWHADLIYIDRKKCVLFVNDRTLTNFLVPDLPRSKIRDLDSVFREWFSPVLHHEGYSANQVAHVLSEYKSVELAASNSRKILGHIKDIGFHYEANIHSAGGVHSPEIPAIIRNLNRMPMNASRECTWPHEELKRLVEKAI